MVLGLQINEVGLDFLFNKKNNPKLISTEVKFRASYF